VKEDGDNRGRGRGNRGYRGRGERGANRNSGEEGVSRGGPRPPRGDRPPRTRANKDGDLPGVATAVSDPVDVSEIK